MRPMRPARRPLHNPAAPSRRPGRHGDLIEVLCAVDRPESILTWKRNIQVLELLGGITSGAIPLTHDGLTAAGPGRHVDHLRSILQHHTDCSRNATNTSHVSKSGWPTNSTPSTPRQSAPPSRQFATWHHLRRLRSESRPGQSSDGPKRSGETGDHRDHQIPRPGSNRLIDAPSPTAHNKTSTSGSQLVRPLGT